MKNNFYTLITLLLSLPFFCFSQESLHCEINRVYPPISISKEKLEQVQSLSDLNNETNDLDLHFKASWIREYLAVDILLSHKGQIKKASGKNDILTQEQKELMKIADKGKEISVVVRYIPENTLRDKEAKELDFLFSIEPEQEAKYYGGEEALNQYLKEKVLDEIPANSFRQYQLAAVKFAINEDGEVVDTHLFWTSENEKIDALLLAAVRNMPCWKPAEYANGVRVKHEYALTVGDLESCVTNLFNTRHKAIFR